MTVVPFKRPVKPAMEGRPAFDAAARGLSVIYHPGEVNRCPGCGRQQWLVGRTTAECAFCATALPIGC